MTKPVERLRKLCSLYIACGAKTDSWQAAGLHTIRRIVVFVDFTIRAKRGLAMMFDGQFVVLHDFARAEACRYTISDWEIVEPHHHMMEEIDQHDARNLRVGKSADDAATTLFDDPDTAFNFSNVF